MQLTLLPLTLREVCYISSSSQGVSVFSVSICGSSVILSAYFPLLLQVWQLAVLSVAVGMPEATDGYSVHPVVAGSIAHV